jgi:hypothetical protein
MISIKKEKGLRAARREEKKARPTRWRRRRRRGRGRGSSDEEDWRKEEGRRLQQRTGPELASNGTGKPAGSNNPCWTFRRLEFPREK